MRKIIALITLMTYILTLCACGAQKTELSDDSSKETFSDTPAPDTDKQDNKEDSDKDTEITDTTPVPDEPKNEYVQPTTFARAYSNVSTLRNAFYDILSTSLTSAGESSQVLIDTYEVVNGEASFVTVSACGSGTDDILKTALAASGYRDVTVNKTEKGEYKISLKVSVSDMTSEEDVFTDGSYYVYYDTEKDSFICEYSVTGIGTEKFRARRIENGYLADYLSPSGKYMRFILMDDNTGKALIYSSSYWKAELPEVKDGFDIDGYVTYYELTDTRFHAIHNGVEYTYHKVLPEGMEDKK